MISFRLFLEKRSHADQNPKISVVDALEKYKDDPDIYLRFFNGDKLERNPMSVDATPYGIYVFAIDKIWDIFLNNKLRYFTLDKVAVLRSKNKDKFIKDLHIEYQRKDLNRDFSIIKKKYGDEFLKKGTSFDEIVDDAKLPSVKYSQKGKKAPGIFFRVMFAISNVLSKDNYTGIWNKILVNDLGYRGMVDRSNKGYIFSEPFQGVFLTNDGYDVVEILENKRYTITLIEKWDDLEKLNEDQILEIIGSIKSYYDYVWLGFHPGTTIGIYKVSTNIFKINPQKTEKFLLNFFYFSKMVDILFKKDKFECMNVTNNFWARLLDAIFARKGGHYSALDYDIKRHLDSKRFNILFAYKPDLNKTTKKIMKFMFGDNVKKYSRFVKKEIENRLTKGDYYSEYGKK